MNPGRLFDGIAPRPRAPAYLLPLVLLVASACTSPTETSLDFPSKPGNVETICWPSCGPRTGVGDRVDIKTGSTKISDKFFGANYWYWALDLKSKETVHAYEDLDLQLLRIGGHGPNDRTRYSPNNFVGQVEDDALGYLEAYLGEGRLGLTNASLIYTVPTVRYADGYTPLEDKNDPTPFSRITEIYERAYNAGVRLFAIGNEPDQAETTYESPSKAGEYCTELFLPIALHLRKLNRAGDIKLIGPSTTWANPAWRQGFVAAGCDDSIIDVYSTHSYPVEPDLAAHQKRLLKWDAWQADIQAAGKWKVAVTEFNMGAEDKVAGTFVGGMINLLHLKAGLDRGLWTMAIWGTKEAESFSMLGPQDERLPSYWTYEMLAGHAGEAHLTATTTAPDIQVFGTEADNEKAIVLVINTSATEPRTLDFTVNDEPKLSRTVPPLSITRVELEKTGTGRLVVEYNQATAEAGLPPQPLCIDP